MASADLLQKILRENPIESFIDFEDGEGLDQGVNMRPIVLPKIASVSYKSRMLGTIYIEFDENHTKPDVFDEFVNSQEFQLN